MMTRIEKPNHRQPRWCIAAAFLMLAALNTSILANQPGPRSMDGARAPGEASAQDAQRQPFTPRNDAILVEGFEDISTLTAQGWVKTNQSSPLGTTGWFQGSPVIFPAQAGPDSSYIAANFENASGSGTVDNWLITPVLPLAQLTELSFWTRSPDDSTFPDRIQVWMNITNTGSDTSDFTVLLADIDPVSTSGWSQTVITSFPDAPAEGRIAFRYFVPNGGPLGSASDFIGIDSLEVLASAPEDHFVTTWQTDNPGTSSDSSITVPMVGGPFDVDWNNDGTFDQLGITGPVTHDFGTPGTYTIRIRGNYDAIRFANDGDKDKILSIDQWGTRAWQTMEDAFYGASSLEVPAADTPNFSEVTNMLRMFWGANLANPDTSNWDTGAVTVMFGMFVNTSSANPNTSGWDTSAVTNMSNMFGNAAAANPDTSNWNTAAVTDMSFMFNNAVSANPDTSNWNTAAVTDMSFMFNNAVSANPDTSNWNTAAVTDMSFMFSGASSANPDTSGWDTSSVQSMRAMFQLAENADPNTSTWNTAAVTDMASMFNTAISANPDTSGWDTSSVQSMTTMFQLAENADPNTSTWNTAAVTDMAFMFAAAFAATPDTSGWDTSAVTTMFAMFNNAHSANPDTSGWNTAAVTDMSSMFNGATSANPNTSGWDTSSVQSMLAMFAAAFAATPDTSGWDTSAVTTMFAMFNNAHSANPDTSGWNTVAVTDMTGMFLDAPAANPDASNWDMGSLVNAEIMFNGSGLTTANYEALVEGWADQTVQSNVSLGALGKFYCSNLAATARAVLADDNQWTITDAGRGCQVGGEVTGLQGSGLILQLNGGNDLAINDNGSFTFPGSLDNLADYTVTVAAQPGNPTQICTVANGTGTVEGPNVTNVAVSCVDDPPEGHFVTTWQTDNPGTSSDSSITVPMVGGPFDVDWNNDGTFDQLGITGPVTHDFGSPGTYTIRIRGNYDAIRFSNTGDKDKILSINQWGTRAWQSMEDAFSGASNLEVPATDTPDFSEVTSMSFMFNRATVANPDTRHWDTSSVESMRFMFNRAESADPDTSQWDTSSVEDMRSMFSRAESADPDTSSWHTSSVRDMRGMFDGASSSNPDTSSWNTSSVESMQDMFRGAIAADPDTSNWDTSSVESMWGMFQGAENANPNTSQWETGSVTNMRRMFQDAMTANPDTSQWNTAAVARTTSMFEGASAANPDTSDWNVESLILAGDMFKSSGLTTANYEALLEGWSLQADAQTDVAFGAPDNFYCSDSAAVARAVLVDDKQWTISDLGRGCAIGGEVAGLQGSGLILQLNGGNDLDINDNGSFTFPGSLDNLADYTVTVAAQPVDPAQICVVANGTGTVEGPNVANVEVSCQAAEDSIFSSRFEQAR